MSADLYDCLVLGAGPAGLAAAVTLGRSYLNILVLSNDRFRNANSGHMHTMPTWDHEDPSKYRAAARKEIADKYKTVTFCDTDITLLEPEATLSGWAPTQFAAVTAQGERFRGRKIIIATGCQDILPPIEGFGDGWGKRIFHCLFCRGYEDYTHLPVGILCLSQEPQKLASTLSMALFSTNFTSSSQLPTLLTNGAMSPSDVEEAAARAPMRGTLGLKIDSRPLKRIEYDPHEPDQIVVSFSEGEPQTFGFLVHKADTQTIGNWAEQLGIETISSNPNSDLKLVSPLGETSVKGVYAAGDCATPLKQVTNAVAMGVIAGASVANAVSVEKMIRRNQEIGLK
ncbi:hypothetical protein A1O3_00494 [Capronia epimyces CBS 606.96]|uniref:FAD/NAD(P)-binding domain-containing protein n=1 Tax=Capronia epimyces CBS 606.96 TaxID=1182542 RepID=W9ZBR0_9EURO|nr:uncharacterized protein A1O3_00494 [Capronia epimyces CBS 606.96]EXJ91944.1 hypothetical protein A1O3_00494 [Capronia epimyces CBS 606.96]